MSQKQLSKRKPPVHPMRLGDKIVWGFLLTALAVKLLQWIVKTFG